MVVLIRSDERRELGIVGLGVGGLGGGRGRGYLLDLR